MTEQTEQQWQGNDESNSAPTVGGAGRPVRGGGRSLRDPGGPTGALLAWLTIIGIVGFLALTPVAMTFFPGVFAEESEGAAVVEHSPPSGPIRLIAKYSVGVSELTAGSEEAMLTQVDAIAESSRSDQLRAVIVAAALAGSDAGLERLERIKEETTEPVDGSEPAKFSPEFAEAYAIVDRALTRGSSTLDQTQRESIVASDGWFGELLLVSDLPEEDPARQAVFAGARRMAMLLVGALLGLLGIGVVGLGLFITAIVLLARGRIRSAYVPPAPGGSVYLEMFALFLVSFFVLQYGGAIVHKAAGVDLSKLLVWLMAPVMFWPLVRGADWASWKHAVGWHRGRGVFREVGAGVLGYLAGLPIVAVGLFLAVVLSALVGLVVEWVTDGVAPPASHPVIDEMGSGGVWSVVMLYLLAAVWAPVFEETFFRGALYHHLRGRLGAIVSALTVALIFASIHPQGIGLIPALMGLAVVFALIREWRGSIIGPVAAHSLHNATLVTILLLALG